MPSVSSDDDLIDLSAALLALWRGKYIIALVVGVFIFLGGYYAYFVATPTFRATAVVMLNNREEQLVDRGNVLTSLGSDASAIATEMEILKSRILLGKVVDELNLTEDPEFNSSLQPPSLLSKIKSVIKSFLIPSSQPIAPTDVEARVVREREAAINRLLNAISISNVYRSVVFQVSAETKSREKSMRIANTLVDQYILNQLEVKFEATQQATKWLTDRVADLQIALEEAETKVEDFRASTSLVSSDGLKALQIQVKETRERIENIESTVQASKQKLEALSSAASPEDAARISGDTQLLQLVNRIDDQAIRQNFNSRLEQFVQRLKIEVGRNESQLASLQASLRTLENQVVSQSQDLITLQQYNREAEASRLLYEYFLGRLKETSALQGIQQADSRVISPAVLPLAPSAPKKPMILAISMVLGFLAGIGVVLLHELRNRAFRTSNEVEKSTGYIVLGQLPMVPKKRRKDVIGYLDEKPTSAAAESVRNLRTSLILSNTNNPPQVIMVCSSLPGEGKTTVTLSLALNFATMGKKVLLIEGDMRRRVFNEYIDISVHQEGLLDVLSGQRDFSEVVMPNKIAQADVLICGEGKGNAADIYSSSSFRAFLEQIREKYDVILIDTPPALVVPDARIISQLVDANLFVVKWDSTKKDQVQSALREFESVGHPVTGLVLNQIVPSRMSRYGYGSSYGYYSYSKSSYYGS